MTVLVIAEHDNVDVADSTLRAITAAGAFGGDVTVLIAGHDCGNAANAAARISGVNKVLCADGPSLGSFLAEPLAELVAAMVADHLQSRTETFEAIVCAANTSGKNLLPRIAGLMDIAMVSDVIAIKSADTFVRPIYAGNAEATVECMEPIKLVSVRPTVFDPAPGDSNPADIESIDAPPYWNQTRLVQAAEQDTGRPDLSSAKIVLSGGRGMQSAENFVILDRVAAKLGAAVGGTRAAVDAGFLPNEVQVGQTGKVVAPDLYMAFGISGAIQHLAGIKDSKVIVAINTDEAAPIMAAADYCLVADAAEVLTELDAALGDKNP
ncbi:MAG: electron transfer flavoprotein subunit alpha/FixB family protein [Alphaproteobacteria bacterium]|jgi:electron transfer flavoprotein alpha subunit|nr:electron transfer flavoprotein subunit alpha/FixB family protein [Alphaproteobacteria bacterium]